MKTAIRTEKPAAGGQKAALLTGEIKGVETFFHRLPAKTRHLFPVPVQKSRIFFFLSGTGVVTREAKSYAINEMALFTTPLAHPVGVESHEDLTFLEFLWDLYPDEKESGEDYFKLYSACEPYAEVIKSKNTVSRTIVPPDVVPRFSMGSVEAKGPDAVAPHAHPMLEQLFFGLEGNQCTVSAGDAAARFEAGMLMHIPPGSRHGVTAAAGEMMNYVWVDFFPDKKGLNWIREQHKPIPAK